MMRNKRKSWKILAIVVVLILSGVETTFATSGTEKLDSFYAAEFKKFNEALGKHLQQLAECMEEMDRFEQGEVFLDPISCSVFREKASEVMPLLEGIETVTKSYIRWLSTRPENNEKKLSSPAFNMTYALIQIYETKYQQAVIQSNRVRKQEGELSNRLIRLFEVLENLNTIEK